MENKHGSTSEAKPAKPTKPAGAIAVIEITKDTSGDEVFKCILKSPSRGILEAALSKMGLNGGQAEIISAGEIVLRGCWIEGDQEILDNDLYLVPAALQAYNLIDLKEAVLKKI